MRVPRRPGRSGSLYPSVLVLVALLSVVGFSLFALGTGRWREAAFGLAVSLASMALFGFFVSRRLEAGNGSGARRPAAPVEPREVPLSVVTRVEDEYAKENKPSLGRALLLLRARWAAGGRDRETALRILFLTWYASAEPADSTGLPRDEDLSSLWEEALAALGGEASADGEARFALRHMAKIAPWACGGGAARGEELFRSVHEAAAPSPDDLRGRGAYGAYFLDIAGSGDSA